MSRTPVTLLALAAAVALLSACASAPPELVAQASPAATPAPTPAPATEQVCRKELPTGMRIPITVCRNVKAMEERREADRAWADRIPTEVHDVGR